ncbi:MAG: peptidoglycan-binding protein [bacterium]|nr:peptidoglycan-binding protein [bacterium]
MCPAGLASAATVLFSDGFESSPDHFLNWTSADTSSGGKWDSSSSEKNSGDFSAQVKGDTGPSSSHDILQKTISTSGNSNITLSFWYRAENLESGDADRLEVYYTTDGSDWIEISSLQIDDDNDDEIWHQSTFVLPVSASDNTSFGFRFEANLDNGNDRVWLDDVSLTGDVIITTGTLTIIKNTIGGNGTFNFTVVGPDPSTDEVLTPEITTSGDSSGGDGSTELMTLDLIGTYTINELAQDGWDFTSATCSSGLSDFDEAVVSEPSPEIAGSDTIIVGNGDDVTCTFTNTAQPAHLTIAKYTDNGSGDGAFNFQITGTDGTEFSHTYPLSTEDGAATTTIDIPAGSFDVSEINLTGGWHFAGVSCLYDDESIGNTIVGGEHIYVGNGDSVTCTFHDTKKAVFTIKKVVVNDNGGVATSSVFSFSINGGETHTTFESDGQNDIVLDPGIYSVTETPADGYTSSLVGCSGIELAAGDTATCTVMNDDIAPTTVSMEEPESQTGGGGNGPIVGSFGQVLGASFSSSGQVLGASTSTNSGASDNSVLCDSKALLTQYMRRGRANDPAQVKLLQQFLNDEVYSNLPLTGFFGVLTENAVNAFQQKYASDILAPWGLTEPTGYVYKLTLWKINSLMCVTLNASKPEV